MKTLKLALGAVVAVAVLGGGALLSGAIPLGDRNPRPSCDELPPTARVETVLAEKKSLVTALEAAAPGVRVDITKPCPGSDVALIVVRYGENRDAVERVYNADNGFGVPVQFVKS